MKEKRTPRCANCLFYPNREDRSPVRGCDQAGKYPKCFAPESEILDVRGIIEAYLKKNCYDGLYWENPWTGEVECDCPRGKYLLHCDLGPQECQPGYRTADEYGHEGIGPVKEADE